MASGPDRALAVRLHGLAAFFVLPPGPSMTEAVVLAEELVAGGEEGPATIAVAALPRDVTRRDADELVRAMLSEQAVPVPPADDVEGEYRALLGFFGSWGLPLHHFLDAFLRHLPVEPDQDALDRQLRGLLHELDHEGFVVEQRAIEERMRAAVRASLRDRSA